MTLVEMLAERQAEVLAETVGNKLCSVKAKQFSILWLKGYQKCCTRHEATH